MQRLVLALPVLRGLSLNIPLQMRLLIVAEGPRVSLLDLHVFGWAQSTRQEQALVNIVREVCGSVVANAVELADVGVLLKILVNCRVVDHLLLMAMRCGDSLIDIIYGVSWHWIGRAIGLPYFLILVLDCLFVVIEVVDPSTARLVI